MEITIRQAGKEDIEGILKLWAGFVEELYPEEKPSIEDYKKQLESFMVSPMYSMKVAEDNGEIIGFMDGVVINDPLVGGPCGYGRQLYVTPEYRKYMLGLKLYRSQEKWARDRGALYIKHYCTDRMQRFYERLGYIKTDSLMQKKLEG